MFIPGDRFALTLTILCLAAPLGSCRGEEVAVTKEKRTLHLTSTAFDNGSVIPAVYSCKGKNLSPPLTFGGVPKEAKGLVLVMDDPDAPLRTWVHWVVYDLPPTTTDLKEAVASLEKLNSGGTHGQNSWKKLGYGGPCPPSGTHRYFFKLYALDTLLALPPGATKEQVTKAMEGHILAGGELVGLFSKT